MRSSKKKDRVSSENVGGKNGENEQQNLRVGRKFRWRRKGDVFV